MKIALLDESGIVVACGIVAAGVKISHPLSVREIRLPDASPVDARWRHAGPVQPTPQSDDPLAVRDIEPFSSWDITEQFSPPAARYALVDADDFYLRFTPDEAVAIKASSDATTKEILFRLNRWISNKNRVDPNLPDVKNMVGYLRSKNLIASSERVLQILTGD